MKIKKLPVKITKIINQGKDQLVLLPKEFQFESSSDVFIKKQGTSIVLIPINKKPWQILFSSLSEFSDDFMSERNQPDQQPMRQILN